MLYIIGWPATVTAGSGVICIAKQILRQVCCDTKVTGAKNKRPPGITDSLFRRIVFIVI